MEAVFEIVWRRKWIILATMLVALAVAYFGSRLIEPTYEATAKLRVLSGGGSVDYIRPETEYNDRIMATYADIATSSVILDQLRDELEIDNLPEFSIDVVPNTELMLIVAEDSSPSAAARGANELADLLIEFSQTSDANSGLASIAILEEQVAAARADLDAAQAEYDNLIANDPLSSEEAIAELEALQAEVEGATFDSLLAIEQETYRSQIARSSASLAVRSEIYTRLVDHYTQALATGPLRGTALSIIEPAEFPRTPSKPDITQNVALGGVLGLLGGVGLAFLLEQVDTTLHSIKRLEEVVGLPVLGRVPLARRSGLLGFLEADAKFLHPEAFRRIRSNLLNAMQRESLRTIMVTSALPGEGKSTVVANLAVSIAETRNRVLVIDADLHRPMMHLTYGLGSKVGLSSVLKEETTLEEAIQETDTLGVFVLTSGPPTAQPHLLLADHSMERVLSHATQLYDIVLIDSPAFLAVADATLLAGMADGIVVVASKGQSKEDTVLTLRQELTKIGAHPIGVIANRTTGDIPSKYSRHYMAVVDLDEPVAEKQVPEKTPVPVGEVAVLPAASQEAVREVEPYPAQLHTMPVSTPRILIVEDDVDFAFAMQESLELNDYEVRVSRDGESALDAALDWKPDVVLLDLALPKLSGNELCRRLKSAEDTAGVRVIMVTGRATISDKRESYEAGADDYLVKPFEWEELSFRIEALLRRNLNNHRAETQQYGV